MPYLDVKVTTWERVEIKEEDKIEVLEKFNSGEIKTTNDIVTYFPNVDFLGTIMEAEETMTVADNDGQPTVELLDDDKRTYLWDNVIFDKRKEENG